MKTLFPITFLVNIVFTVVEFMLAVRILLKLLGANPSAPFVNWVYETTRPLLSPFVGIFPNPTFQNGFILEISSLFALLTYGFIAYLITEVIEFFEARSMVYKKK